MVILAPDMVAMSALSGGHHHPQWRPEHLACHHPPHAIPVGPEELLINIPVSRPHALLEMDEGYVELCLGSFC